tara:strand:- start:39 stop:638 length:600 start_codon:yes stop_codon:yes gene_type:complete
MNKDEEDYKALTVDQVYWIHRTLSMTMSVFESNGLSYWANGGTLLGAIRCGGIVSWDDDVDLAIREEDVPLFLEIAEKKFKLLRLQLSRPSNKYYKIKQEDGHDIWIDICIIREDGTDLRGHKIKRKYLKDEIFPLRKVQFSTFRDPIPIPLKSEEYLDRVFPNWRTEAVIYSHKDGKKNKVKRPLTHEMNVPYTYHYK